LLNDDCIEGIRKMNLIVCIKQVPDPLYYDRIILDPKSKLVKREGVPSIMNPVDANAVETALRIRDIFGGKVTVVTMGPPQAAEILEESFAMGADEGILLSDRAFAGADATATARTLASAIKKIGQYDLVICGFETVDSGTRQIGPQLAEYLDLPHVTNTGEIRFEDPNLMIVTRKLENGYAKIAVDLPAVVAVSGSINEPRIPSVMGILSVASKPLMTYGLVDLHLRNEEVGLAGSPTQMADITEYKQKRLREIYQGDPTESVKKAVLRLKELQVIP